MEKYVNLRIICLIPFGISLLVCIVSMFTGVGNGLFGVQTTDYGTTAFMWMLIVQVYALWPLYVICIIGIVITSIKIHKCKRLNDQTDN